MAVGYSLGALASAVESKEDAGVADGLDTAVRSEFASADTVVLEEAKQYTDDSIGDIDSGVVSWNGRVGVVAPVAGDYEWDDIDEKPLEFPPSTHTHTAADLPATMPPSTHAHSAGDITTGTLGVQRVPASPASATAASGFGGFRHTITGGDTLNLFTT